MLAAAAGAAVLGAYAEGAFLLFLFSLGHAGEQYALDRARNAVDALGQLMPKTARVKKGDRIIELPVERIQLGDIVVVRPADRFPVDGQVRRGHSTVDQSPITGESVPVAKGPGDEVYAGTVNQEAAVDVRVTSLAKDNTLNRIMQMVADAQEQQSPSQQFAQRFTCPVCAPGPRSRRPGHICAPADRLDAHPGQLLPRHALAGRRLPLRPGHWHPGRRAIRHRPGGPQRRPHQGRRSPGAPGHGQGHGFRQNRHPDQR